MARHQLTDQQWECIESFFKQRAKTGRPPAESASGHGRHPVDRSHRSAVARFAGRVWPLGRPCITISTSGVPRAS